MRLLRTSAINRRRKRQTLSDSCLGRQKSQTLSGILQREICCRNRCRHCQEAWVRIAIQTVSANLAHAGLARRSWANVGTQPRKSGGRFDGDDFDEIGSAEPPELAELVASHLTSSSHAL